MISPLIKAHFTSMWCISHCFEMQWLRLALWSPSLPLVQRSHFNLCHEPMSRPWIPIWPCTLEVNHQQQIWSCRPTYTELTSSLGEDPLAPMCCSSGVSWNLPSWLLAILDLLLLIHMFEDPIPPSIEFLSKHRILHAQTTLKLRSSPPWVIGIPS